MELFERFNQWADHTGESIIDWSRPDVFPETSYTQDWPLTRFRDAVFIAICYLLFVLFGYLIMQFLPAVDLYIFKFIYNIMQVMLCAYMCIEAFLLAYRHDYSWVPCVEFNASKPLIADLLWIFYASKVFDFFDTIFIILSKKFNQLSFLHIYHHTSIFLFYWLNINVGYDGDIYLTIILNGFIHMVMYLYYFVSLHSPSEETVDAVAGDKKKKMKAGIWWKPIVTFGQEIQFVLMISQAIYMISIDCQKYPLKIIKTYAVYITSLLILFINFSMQNYGKKDKTKKDVLEVADAKKTK